MLPRKISEQILTIGCSYKHPKGGVAQVMKSYETSVFSDFKCIINSGGNNRLTKSLRAVWASVEMTIRLFFDWKIKIVHIHTASYNSFRRSALFLRLAKAFRKKVILHIHGGGFKEYYASNPVWIANILDCSDAIISLSESWRAFLASVTFSPQIDVLENIVDCPQKIGFAKTDHRFHLLFLGKIDEQKGIFDLLETIHDYYSEFSGRIKLHIGGNGDVERLHKLIHDYELEEEVCYEGFVSGEKKNTLLSKSDAYILPSYTEGLPVSILEAMSYRLAVISTPVGGIPEVIEDGVNGILVQPGDKDAITFAILRLMNDSYLCNYMGAVSYQRVQTHFPDTVSKNLEDIYMNLLAK